MITSLEIEGLRGIKRGKIDGLRQLTFLVGSNGCGKSTILEAAGVACAGVKAEHAFRALADREWLGLAGMTYWCDRDAGAKIIGTLIRPVSDAQSDVETVIVSASLRTPVPLHVGATQAARNERETGDLMGFRAAATLNALRPDGQRPQVGHNAVDLVINDDGRAIFSTPQSPVLPFEFLGTFADRAAGARQRLQAGRFSSALRDALTAIKRAPWYDDFESYLRELRPKVDHIESLAIEDRDEPFIIEREPRVIYPVAYAGDGFRRALLLAATLAGAKGGVAALDEPEAFAHPRMGRELARLFRRSLDDGTQILISTHSLEFIEIVLQELKDPLERVAIVGLAMTDGVLSPTIEHGADAYRRIVEMRDDLRL